MHIIRKIVSLQAKISSMRKVFSFLFIILINSTLCFSNDTVPIKKSFLETWSEYRKDPREPRPPRPHHEPRENGIGKRVTLGLSFGIGPDWLNPRTDSLYRNGPIVALKYGIPIDINFNQKENYYFTTGIFFNHSGGKFHLTGLGYGADSVLRILDRQYSAIYLTIPTGIKLKTPSMNGFVVAANFGLYHSFRLNAKVFDKYRFQGNDVKTNKYMYMDETALFREAGYIGLGMEYVVTDNFRLYFYAIYNHTFTNFFNPKKSYNLANDVKDKASLGGVELQIGLCF